MREGVVEGERLTVAQIRLVTARFQAVDTRLQRVPKERPIPGRAILEGVIPLRIPRIQVPRKNRILQWPTRPTDNTRRVDDLVLIPKPIKARSQRMPQIIQHPVVVCLRAVRLLALLEAFQARLELFALVAVAVEGVLADNVGGVGG